MRPKVSIIMPVLNGEKYIGEAIRSIVAQSYSNYELVVIDDGSTDGTKQQLDSFAGQLEIKYVHHPAPKGIPASMNDGLRHASGDLIAFLDHDDAWFPEFLETQVTYLQEHPDVGMVHSDIQTIDGEGNVIEASVAVCRKHIPPSGNIFPQLFMQSLICGNSVLIRKNCFQHLGHFDENLHFGDYHMWMRIARHYRIDYVGKVLTKYRQHQTQSTRTLPVDRPNEDSAGIVAVKKIIELYPQIWEELGKKRVRRRLALLYFDMAYSAYLQGLFHNARICVAKAIRLWRTRPRYYLFYATTFLLPSHVSMLRAAMRRLRTFFSFGESGIDWTRPMQRTIDRKKQ